MKVTFSLELMEKLYIIVACVGGGGKSLGSSIVLVKFWFTVFFATCISLLAEEKCGVF